MEFARVGDSAVTGLVDASRIPPSPEVHLPVVLRAFRSEARDAISSEFSASAGPGTTIMLKGNLGVLVIPITSGPLLYAIFARAFLVSPSGPPPVSAQPAARWSYAKMVKALALYPRAVGGVPYVFDDGSGPEMKATSAGREKVRSHATRGQGPFLLAGMRVPADAAALDGRVPRRPVERAELAAPSCSARRRRSPRAVSLFGERPK